MFQKSHHFLRQLRYLAKFVNPIWTLFNQMLRTAVLVVGLLAQPATSSSNLSGIDSHPVGAKPTASVCVSGSA